MGRIAATRRAAALLVTALIVTVASATPAGAQEAALAELRAQIVGGQVVEDLTSAADPTQRFAVYAPTGYASAGPRPVLFLLDPRGRAMVPMELFVPAAERHGWVLVSSYNSASDTAEDRNSPAMRAMLRDASQLFALDARRAYIAGFSGTARAAWEFAFALGDTAAGIIGFGAGLPYEGLRVDPPFAFYGAAGFTDFNYEEMRTLEAMLAERPAVQRIEFFPGGHQWGTPEVCSRAVDWMEVQAMRGGRRPRDLPLIEEILAARVAEAEAWESDAETEPMMTPAGPTFDRRGPRAFEAYVRYRAIVEDFDTLVDTGILEDIAARADRLAATPVVQQAIATADQLAEEDVAARNRFRRVLGQIATGDGRWSLSRAVRDIQLEELHDAAADAERPAEAQAAQRLVSAFFTQTAFYQPQAMMERGEHDRAVRMYELADAIVPGTFGVARARAIAHAAAGDVDEAMAALDDAHAIRPLDVTILESDPAFEPIRDTDEFQALLGRLRQGS